MTGQTPPEFFPPAGWGQPGLWPAKAAFYLRNRGERLRRRCYQLIYDIQDHGRAHFTILWDRPLVIYAAYPSVHRLLPLPRGSLVLLALYHSGEEAGARSALIRYLRRHFPDGNGVDLIVLANTAREAEFLAADGIRTVFLNHNAFVDERRFVIRPDIPKRFDAIYDAQLGPYKRHDLAVEIDGLALISYMNRPSPDLRYARTMRERLRHATWLNDPLARDYRRLDESEVCAALNAARVGLCLSLTEGAMYASCQYLLCGLPVVTTENLGGRDAFFEPDFALTVDATPEAVAAGVRSIVARAVDPEGIRARTLVRIREQRARFIALAQAHLDRHLARADFAAHFDRIFFHKLLKFRRVKGALSRIGGA